MVVVVRAAAGRRLQSGEAGAGREEVQPIGSGERAAAAAAGGADAAVLSSTCVAKDGRMSSQGDGARTCTASSSGSGSRSGVESSSAPEQRGVGEQSEAPSRHRVSHAAHAGEVTSAATDADASESVCQASAGCGVAGGAQAAGMETPTPAVLGGAWQQQGPPRSSGEVSSRGGVEASQCSVACKLSRAEDEPTGRLARWLRLACGTNARPMGQQAGGPDANAVHTRVHGQVGAMQCNAMLPHLALPAAVLALAGAGAVAMWRSAHARS